MSTTPIHGVPDAPIDPPEWWNYTGHEEERARRPDPEGDNSLASCLEATGRMEPGPTPAAFVAMARLLNRIADQEGSLGRSWAPEARTVLYQNNLRRVR